MRYVDYDVVYAADLTQLIKLVKEYLNNGWVPMGGMMTTSSQIHDGRHGGFITEDHYYQSVALPATDPNPSGPMKVRSSERGDIGG